MEVNTIIEKAKLAAKEYADSKSVAKRSETNFLAGVNWLLNEQSSYTEEFYTNQLKDQIKDRTGEPAPPWMSLIISTTAQLLCDIDSIRADIRIKGRVWKEFGYNQQEKSVMNPEVAHLKDLVRSLHDYYVSLGLSFKATPAKIKENTKKGVDDDPLLEFYKGTFEDR